MTEIIEVRTKKQQKEFVSFPLRLYKNNPYFVPPLYGDEMKMFRRDYVYNDTCEHIEFLAVQNGKTVGRIQGIIQNAANLKNNEKRVRFTRFDSINSTEVSSLLFSGVEKWAREKGMDTIVGPLGFSDLEREGLLIEGFDQISTFEEQYNFDYYRELIESAGFEKEVDWLESKITLPQNDDTEKMKKTEEFVLKRYRLHIGTAKNTNDFLKRYADGFFELLDRSYEKIYGTVPFTEGMKKMMIDNFRLIIDTRFVVVVLDENEKVVCLGICFPSLAGALQKSGGKLTPPALLKVLKAIKAPEIIDLGLVGVAPEYMNCGISVVVSNGLMNMLRNSGIKYAETNLNLEDNYPILNLWKRFGHEQHKKRRCFIKRIEND